MVRPVVHPQAVCLRFAENITAASWRRSAAGQAGLVKPAQRREAAQLGPASTCIFKALISAAVFEATLLPQGCCNNAPINFGTALDRAPCNNGKPEVGCGDGSWAPGKLATELPLALQLLQLLQLLKLQFQQLLQPAMCPLVLLYVCLHCEN